MNIISMVDSQNLTDKLIHDIEESILNGTLKIGDKLPTEKELADQAGIGRRAIREALNALRLKGLVETRKGSGTFVIRDDLNFFLNSMVSNVNSYLHQNKANIVHVLDFRKIINRCAIERLIDTSGNTATLNRLEKNLLTQKQAFWKRDSHTYNNAHKDFHLLLVDSMQNPLISMFHQQTLNLITTEMTMQSQLFPTMEENIREHEELIRFIREKDLKSALATLEKHLDHAYHNFTGSDQE